jgi:hypothetical protein
MKIFKNLAGLPIFYIGSNESSLVPSSNGWKIPVVFLLEPKRGGDKQRGTPLLFIYSKPLPYFHRGDNCILPNAKDNKY